MEFKVGDRILCVETRYKGKRGKIVHINDDLLGVAFDEVVFSGHDCNRHCEYGHGKYLLKRRFILENINKRIEV
jgi:hypothetical protein